MKKKIHSYITVNVLLHIGTFMSPLMLFPFVLFDAVEQTAGDEGHGHEEDDARAYNGCQHSHAETVVLIDRHSWSVRDSFD